MNFIYWHVYEACSYCPAKIDFIKHLVLWAENPKWNSVHKFSRYNLLSFIFILYYTYICCCSILQPFILRPPLVLWDRLVWSQSATVC